MSETNGSSSNANRGNRRPRYRGSAKKPSGPPSSLPSASSGSAAMNPNAQPFDPAPTPTPAPAPYNPSVVRVRKTAAPENKENAPQRNQAQRSHARGGAATTQQAARNPARRREQLEKERQNMDLAARLTAQLNGGVLECMICYDFVRPKDPIWTCSKSCFAVFHAKCIRVWAASSSSSNSNLNLTEKPEWRCPGCQFKSNESPYPSCFCGKTDHPNSRVLNATAHSCGDQCLKPRSCPHKCTAVCHPGPCEKCELTAPEMDCYCGKVVLKFRCADVEESMDLSCGQICGKLLSCGKHECPNPCHDYPCAPCPEQIEIDCQCGKCTTSVSCDFDSKNEVFQCEELCNVGFPCGIHVCEETCHKHEEGALCATDPGRVETCPCGAETVISLLGGRNRESCTEAIPLCENTCAKTLKCGHICTAQCHNGECAPCAYKVNLPCRCGKSTFALLCGEIELNEEGTYQTQLCDRVCTMKRSCKRHLCNNVCCPTDLASHYCELQCGKTLRCGQHNCQMACGHSERCHDCFEGVSFEELSCTCGSSVLYPPIACGTEPPKCNRPCRLPLSCGHVAYSNHQCHPRSEPCPKCMIFVDRECACGKSVMKNVACSRIGAPSCGKPCNKPVDGCLHPCKRACHAGECIDANNKCLERCNRPRPMCGHVCAYPCHRKNFCTEDKPCQQKVKETCPCGHRSAEFPCGAWKENSGRASAPSRLQCDDACAVFKRNKALAEALEIDTAAGTATPNAPTSLPLTELPNVTTSLSAAARLEPLETQLHILKYAYQNLIWCRTVEKVLSDFVNDGSKKTHHYMCTKPLGIRFLVALAPYYGLDAEVVDASWGTAKTSVILRKRLRGSPAAIPATLCSSIAPNYQAIAASLLAPPPPPPLSENVLESDEAGKQDDGPSDLSNPAITHHDGPPPPVSSVSTAVNGFKVMNLRGSLEDRDICDLVEPVLGCPVSVTWLMEESKNNCVIQLVEGGIDMSEVEYILATNAETLYGKVVMDGLAEELELCWINHKQQVTAIVPIGMKRGGRKGKEVKDMPQKQRPAGIGRESMFSALMNDE
ncbi:hypothetical protein BDR26DRAFT_852230, partial [Obelidium mucronatum]